MTNFRRLASRRMQIWRQQQNALPPTLLPPNVPAKLKPLEYATRLSLLGVIVCAVMAQFGCSTLPSTLPMVPRTPPQACYSSCPHLPLLADGRDLTVRLWELDVIDIYGTCRRDKETCGRWLREMK